jgi:hypothetical protein
MQVLSNLLKNVLYVRLISILHNVQQACCNLLKIHLNLLSTLPWILLRIYLLVHVAMMLFLAL